MFSIVKKGYLKILLNYRRTNSNFIQWARPSSDVRLFWAELCSNFGRSLVSYCYGGGRRCKAATNCLKFPKIMPPKSLDGDSAQVPKVSRASDGKGPFTQCWQTRKLIKRSFFHHCGTIIYCACVVEKFKNSKRSFYIINGKSYRKALNLFYFECTEKKKLLWAHFFVSDDPKYLCVRRLIFSLTRRIPADLERYKND